ncbi:MAG: flagellar hook-associated protein FlgK [Firmicutes bacterium]|nr:flagellar hook-associated protein FlgK [Bacillota bacterium]
MATTFVGFAIVQSALEAMQEAVNVAGQNVANATTPGYSRERAQLVTEPTVVQAGTGGPVTDAVLGTGVNIANVERVVESYLNAAVRNAQSNASYQDQVVAFLQNAQSLYNEPGANGLSSTMQKFFTDLATLSQDPQSSAARAVVGQDAANVAAQFNTLASGLSQLGTALEGDLATQVGQVNQALSQVASLNQEIQNAQIQGMSANSLLDQRDQILAQLSQSMAIQVGTDASGNLTVTDAATGALLVDGQSYGQLATNGTLGGVAAAAWQVVEQGLPTTPGGAAPPAALADITSGQIGADLTLLGGTAYPAGTTPPAYFGALAPPGSSAYGQSLQAGLDQVAATLAGAINALQLNGYYLDSSGSPVSAASPPVPFFINGAAATQTNPPSGIGAANLAVNPAILSAPYEIAAAQTASAGDGSNALAMADYGQSTQPSAAVPLYSGQVSALGVQVAAALSQQTTNKSLLTQAKNMQQSVSGVSLNEEFANLTQYQDVYTAAAKAMGAMQTMLATLLSVVP